MNFEQKIFLRILLNLFNNEFSNAILLFFFFFYFFSDFEFSIEAASLFHH